jgi:tRNA pseudouridine55 synthase
LGQATKLAPYISSGQKTYQGWLQLGLTTDTYDIQGKVEKEAPWAGIEPEAVRQAVATWPNLREQEVPPYSAAKHKGRPLYELKRKGLEVPTKTKPVQVFAAQCLDTQLPKVHFSVTCSKGTYVRSLAHSLGKRLGCGAVLTALVRKQNQPFSLDQAHTLEAVLSTPEALADKVLPLEQCLPHWPKVTLSGRQAREIQNGAQLPVKEVDTGSNVNSGDRVQFVDGSGRLLALVESRWEGPLLVWKILRGFPAVNRKDHAQTKKNK